MLEIPLFHTVNGLNSLESFREWNRTFWMPMSEEEGWL